MNYRFGDVQIDVESFRLWKAGRALAVEPKALNLLIFLLENRGRLIRKRELIEAVWNDAFVTEQVLTRAIAQLRRLLQDDPKEPKFIETVPTLGFRFIAEVDRESPLATREMSVSKTSMAGLVESGIRPDEIQPRQDKGNTASTAPRRALDASRQRAASVAVLPFVNLSGDPENEFFADGITQDVIAHLAKIKAIKVISRTSIMAFKKSNSSLREIGEKLGAATLLEGSVRRASNRVRIVAQLVDAATDEHIWAETYDRDLTDIFAIQTDVALNIANALRAELSMDERMRLGRRPTYDLEAYDLYLRGLDGLYRFTEEGYRRGLVAFEAAVARDPSFAKAWAAIAECYAEVGIGGVPVKPSAEIIRLAKSAAARALEIDPDLPEAHGVSGLLRFVFDFDWSGAESELLKTIELSPSSAQVHDHYGRLCSATGRYDDALREVRRARALDPLRIQSDTGTILLRAGRNEEALEEALRSVREDPEASRCHSNLGWAYIFKGNKAAGIESLERAVSLSPQTMMFLAQLGEAHALTGNRERALEILQQVRERSAREFVSPYHIAYIYAGLNEPDAAMDCLERAYEQRSGAIYGIKGSFLFRNLRGHPRFKSLLRKINLD